METNWNEKLQKAASFGIVILGNILYALAVRLFLMPAGLLTGGTTGIGLALTARLESRCPPLCWYLM